MWDILLCSGSQKPWLFGKVHIDKDRNLENNRVNNLVRPVYSKKDRFGKKCILIGFYISVYYDSD